MISQKFDFIKIIWYYFYTLFYLKYHINMEFIILILIIIFIYFIFFWNKNYKINIDETLKITHEFLENIEKSEYLMTYTEKKFFESLNNYLKNKNYILFTKVRLADIFKIKKWRWYKGLSTYNRIKSKHVDFVITDINWKILKVIELDDYRHKKININKSDSTKNIIFKTFNIDFIRFEVGKKWNIEELNL